jgi:hypothetical protein
MAEGATEGEPAAEAAAAVAVEVVVVLGCKVSSPTLRERVSTAVAAWRAAGGEASGALLVCTGWRSEATATATEAATMAQMAVEELHVPKQCVLLEPEAAHTLDNAVNVYLLLVAHAREQQRQRAEAAGGWAEAATAAEGGARGDDAAALRAVVRGVTVVSSDWHLARAMLAFKTSFAHSGVPLRFTAAATSGAPPSARPSGGGGSSRGGGGRLSTAPQRAVQPLRPSRPPRQPRALRRVPSAPKRATTAANLVPPRTLFSTVA